MNLKAMPGSAARQSILHPTAAAMWLLLAASPALGEKSPAPSASSSAATRPVSSKPAARPAAITAQERVEADRMDPLAQAAFWDRVVQSNPRDVEAEVKLARALRELARYDEAEAAVTQALVIAPNNVEALLESARDRIAAGQGFFAIEPAERAADLAPRDWRCQSLLAIGLEQAQRDDEALAAHERAVALAPDNPAALSNLAMYEAAHGQAAQAEALLRRAASQPGATARVRENLALILGLEGRMDEAERIERQDLPPAAVENNLAYFRAAQAPAAKRTWQSLETNR
ncbi:MAG: tetratricopeptide repeat protein [Caulobacteraceae bacterium]